MDCNTTSYLACKLRRKCVWHGGACHMTVLSSLLQQLPRVLKVLRKVNSKSFSAEDDRVRVVVSLTPPPTPVNPNKLRPSATS